MCSLVSSGPLSILLLTSNHTFTSKPKCAVRQQDKHGLEAA